MKILLMSPPIMQSEDIEKIKKWDDGDISKVPIGLYILATILRDRKYDVSLENFSLSRYSEAVKSIVDYSPGLLGITCCTSNRHIVTAICDDVKKKLPETKIILGGPHPTPLYEQILEHYESVDFIAVGESEKSFPEFVGKLECEESYDDIKGIAFRRDGEIVFNGMAEWIEDLDSLPIPAKYFEYNTISTSRGCPGRCTFCSSPAIWGRKIRFRSKEHVLKELKMLKEKYDLKEIMFKDDTFSANKARATEIMKGMVEEQLNYKWSCDTRVDFIDEERLYWMRKSGCVLISYGIESGSELILKNINKRTSLEQVRKASELTRKYCIHMRFFLIGGNIGETNETLADTIKLIKECKPNACLITRLYVYPGTDVYKSAIDRKLLTEDVWLKSKEDTISVDFGTPVEKLSNFQKIVKEYDIRYTGKMIKEFEYTVEEWKMASALVSDDVGTVYSLAAKQLEMKNYDEAKAGFKKVIELKPDNEAAWIHLGDCYLAQGEESEAEKAWSSFLNLENQLPGNMLYVLIKLGRLYTKRQTFAEAEEILLRAIEIEPRSFEAYAYLGDLYSLTGKLEEAFKVLTKAVNLNAKFPDTFNSLGKCFFAIDQLDNALDAFNVALENGYHDPSELYNNIGVIYFTQKDLSNAEKYLQMALKENPDNENARDNLKDVQNQIKG